MEGPEEMRRRSEEGGKRTETAKILEAVAATAAKAAAKEQQDKETAEAARRMLGDVQKAREAAAKNGDTSTSVFLGLEEDAAELVKQKYQEAGYWANVLRFGRNETRVAIKIDWGLPEFAELSPSEQQWWLRNTREKGAARSVLSSYAIAKYGNDDVVYIPTPQQTIAEERHVLEENQTRTVHSFYEEWRIEQIKLTAHYNMIEGDGRISIGIDSDVFPIESDGAYLAGELRSRGLDAHVYSQRAVDSLPPSDGWWPNSA
jgi:hypothetical protein